MNLAPKEMDKVMQKFKKASNIKECENTNTFVSFSEIKQINREIKRLKIISRECKGDTLSQWADEEIIKLNKKLK